MTMSPTKESKSKRHVDGEDYRQKRDKNNLVLVGASDFAPVQTIDIKKTNPTIPKSQFIKEWSWSLSPAVKRSRDKTKQKTKLTLDRVMQLKTENETLEEKINLLTKELSFLKDLFLAHAGSSNSISLGIDLETILADNQSSSAAILKLLSDPSFKSTSKSNK